MTLFLRDLQATWSSIALIRAKWVVHSNTRQVSLLSSHTLEQIATKCLCTTIMKVMITAEGYWWDTNKQILRVPFVTGIMVWHSRHFLSIWAMISQSWRSRAVNCASHLISANMILKSRTPSSFPERCVCNNNRHQRPPFPLARWMLIPELLCLHCTGIPLGWVLGRFVFQERIPNGVLAHDKELKP